MTPDLSYATTGRAGESSARMDGKKTDTKSRTTFQTSYTTST